MKLVLENREYDFKANGYFLKKYQETFPDDTFMKAIVKLFNEKDVYSCARLIYCGINEEMSFDEWLNSFQSPIFCLDSTDKIGEYLTRKINPTVESKGEDLKKKKTI